MWGYSGSLGWSPSPPFWKGEAQWDLCNGYFLEKSILGINFNVFDLFSTAKIYNLCQLRNSLDMYFTVLLNCIHIGIYALKLKD